MSTEAATVEPGTDQATTPETLPDGGQVSPETPPENTPPEPKAEPEKPELPPEKEEQLPDGEAQIQLYREVLSKSNADSNYQMTDEEAEAFLFVQDQIADGTLEDPGPAEPKSDEKPTQDGEKKEEKEGKTPEEKTGDLPEVSEYTLSDANSKVLISAMNRVGAKDISELDGKVEGLINTMKSSGGKLGNEVKAMKEREEAHISWLQDLKSGKQEAWDYLEKQVGKRPAKGSSQPPQEDTYSPEDDDTDLSPDDYLDDRLAKKVSSLEALVKQQANTIEKLSKGDEARAEAAERKNAADGWVDDVVDLVTDPKNTGAFSLTASEARALAQEYWGPDGHTKAVHPKFQQIHELIQFAHQRSMPDLKSAYIVWHHENGEYAKKLIQATKNGQQSVQHQPSQNAFISQKQAKMKTNVPSPNISEQDVERMERGDFDAIPDEWMDDEGNLLPDKVPERFHKAAFGKLGKPK